MAKTMFKKALGFFVLASGALSQGLNTNLQMKEVTVALSVWYWIQTKSLISTLMIIQLIDSILSSNVASVYNYKILNPAL